MKNQQYELSKLKKQLAVKKANGQKEINWSLRKLQVEYLKDLGYKVVPFLYSIRTRKMKYIRDLPHPILKEIHFKYKKGKKIYTRCLKDSEKQILEEYDITFFVCKYTIYLN